MVHGRKVNFGSLEPTKADAVKPIDRYATLEILDKYITYTKRYRVVNRTSIMSVAKYLLDHYDLSIIDQDKAREIEEDCKAKHLKPQTIIRKLHGLVLISEAIGKPIKIKMPKIVREEKVGLTLLECRALISLMLCTGARAKEVIASNVDDIDLKQRFFYIRAHNPEEIVKNYREHKAILTKDCATYLSEWIQIRGTLDDKALFVNQWGKRLSKHSLNKIVIAVAKRAGIEKRVYPHLLRAACATNLLRSGISLNDVAAQLNHRSILCTMVYLTSDTETLRDSIDKRFML
jgi:integrase